jgi:ABC-type multidrug transport system fused ATPase/permease subunit
MTPDELNRIGRWVAKRGGWLAWLGVCLLFAGLALLMRSGRASTDLEGIKVDTTVLYVSLFLIPVPYMACLLYRLNNRIARFRLRKQDSLARLTKRHEKMLIKIRELEREVSERTEDLPPETIPVTMRGDA